jgi:hypothetical protein
VRGQKAERWVGMQFAEHRGHGLPGCRVTMRAAYRTRRVAARDSQRDGQGDRQRDRQCVQPSATTGSPAAARNADLHLIALR